MRYTGSDCKRSRRLGFSTLETGKELKIPAGTKILRAFRKVLEYYNFPYMDDFEKWRDDLSVISTDKKIKKSVKKVSVKNTSVRLKKLNTKKTYYVKVAAYIRNNDKKLYGKYSKIVKLKK